MSHLSINSATKDCPGLQLLSPYLKGPSFLPFFFPEKTAVTGGKDASFSSSSVHLFFPPSLVPCWSRLHHFGHTDGPPPSSFSPSSSLLARPFIGQCSFRGPPAPTPAPPSIGRQQPEEPIMHAGRVEEVQIAQGRADFCATIKDSYMEYNIIKSYICIHTYAPLLYCDEV